MMHLLECAIRVTDLEIIGILLKRPGIEQADLDDALREAVSFGMDETEEIVRMLLTRGADPKNAGDLLSDVLSVGACRLLLDHGAKSDEHVVMNQIRYGGPREIVEMLLTPDIPVDGEMLEAAFDRKNFDLCRMLMDRGAPLRRLLTVRGAIRPRLRNFATAEEIAFAKGEFKVRKVMEA